MLLLWRLVVGPGPAPALDLSEEGIREGAIVGVLVVLVVVLGVGGIGETERAVWAFFLGAIVVAVCWGLNWVRGVGGNRVGVVAVRCGRWC